MLPGIDHGQHSFPFEAMKMMMTILLGPLAAWVGYGVLVVELWVALYWSLGLRMGSFTPSTLKFDVSQAGTE